MATQKDPSELLIAIGVLPLDQIPDTEASGPSIQKELSLKTLLHCQLEKRIQLIEQFICSRC